MYQLFGTTLLALCVFSIAVYGQTSTTQTPLAGAWRVAEVTPVNGQKITDPQPGLYVFTSKYYSFLAIPGTERRPFYRSNAEATEAEKVASFDQLFAQAGTYTVDGSLLVTKTMVAKSEFGMAPSSPGNRYEFAVNGNTLILTAKPASGGPGQIIRLIRLD